MFSRLTLKTRVYLTIAGVLSLIVLVGGFLVIRHVRASVAQETESALMLVRNMLVPRRGAIPVENIPTWIALAERLSRARHVHLTVLRGESRIPPPPRIFALRAPGWFVRLVHPEPMMVEQRVPTREGGELRIVLVADPGDEIAEAWEETQVFLGLLGLLAAGCFLALTWIIGRAFRPVDQVLEGLVALERGDYHHRLPDFPQPEWRRIAAAFNHCAGVLEQARADNRKLMRQLLQVEEEERNQLAHELHDELGQVLSAIKVMALSIRKQPRPERGAQAAALIIEQVDRLFGRIRMMIHRLRPLMLDDLGLAAALETLIDDWRHRQPEVHVRLDCDPRVDTLPPQAHIHVYRIVQEALTNAFRHAQAHRIEITLRVRGHGLAIEIRDDGKGAPESVTAGFGLRGMRERVESLGGRFGYATAPGRGFHLTIQLPIEDEKDHAPSHHAGG